MDKKGYLVVAILLGITLFAVGVLVGRLWSRSDTLALSLPEGAASVESVGDTVRLVGHGVVVAEPEVAKLYMGVEVCSKDASEANREVDAILGEVMERLREAGVSEEEINPFQFSLYPRRSDYGAGRVTGFCAVNKLQVTTEEVEGVSALLDVAIEAGVTNVYGVVFTERDEDAIRQEAIRRAYADVEGQAQELTRLLGRSIDRVVEVKVEVGDSLSWYMGGYYGGGGTVRAQEGTVEAVVEVVYQLK